MPEFGLLHEEFLGIDRHAVMPYDDGLIDLNNFMMSAFGSRFNKTLLRNTTLLRR